MAHQHVRIGVLGCGNVGAAFVGLVAAQAKEIEARTGVALEVTRVAVRNLARTATSSWRPACSPAMPTTSSPTPTSTSSSRSSAASSRPAS